MDAAGAVDEPRIVRKREIGFAEPQQDTLPGRLPGTEPEGLVADVKSVPVVVLCHSIRSRHIACQVFFVLFITFRHTGVS